jgi:hypothetical protein
VPVREQLGDEVLDALLERSRGADGGLRLTGEGSMLGDLVKAVLSVPLKKSSRLISAIPGTSGRGITAVIHGTARSGKACRPWVVDGG